MQTTISITVKSADTAGMFTTMLEGEVLVESSAEPLLAAARTLIEQGVDPSITIAMQHPGSTTIALSSTIGMAARLTVEDGRQRRARGSAAGSAPSRVGHLAAHAFWRGGGTRHSPGRRPALQRGRGGAMKVTPARCRRPHHSQPGACPPPPRSPASGCRPRPRCHAARRSLASLVRRRPASGGPCPTAWTVPPDVAAILIARPDIVAVGDTLFSNTRSQTWRYLDSHNGD